MVLAEVPLWASHGTTTEDNAAKTLPGMEGAAKPTAAPAVDTQQSRDKAAAKSALSLLASTRAGGALVGASRRAPLYSVDVHPDGTRFATAAGDGTVKIWGTGCLFNGKLLKDEKGKEKGATSRFTEGGNYVSSNTEDCDASSSEDDGGKKRAAKGQQKAGAAQAGVNDLSGLVRKKKGGSAPSSSAGVKGSPAAGANPFADAAAAPSNAEGPMSPLSRLTQRPANANAAATVANPSNADTNNASQKHKLLCTLSASEGSVLSLRFSPSGTYLATAGDDSYVSIYARSNAPSPAKGNLTGGSSDGEDIEHWNRVAICRGHHLDVVGLAWAPDDSHLVSCSLDCVHPVIVWKLYDVLSGDEEGAAGMAGSRIHNLHPYKVLGKDVHTSTVKGVAFDPAGRFIATSGDDPAICIWRASDDWGLEARIDSSSGVFKSKKRRAKGDEGAEEEDDPGELAGLSLFRRISFAPDGSHVCGTNAALRGKNVAAMISREGWAASGPRDKADGDASKPPPGAANLVGHKQPVVASRHCPVFFRAPKRGDSSDEDSGSDDDPDAEPEYATLVALGDKRGFVTVWSTKSSRPLFKMQCSESRCTVTDIAWGVVRSRNGKGDSLVMIVSLLDGYVVALHFDVPAEVGGGDILSSEKTRRIFKQRYGIEDFVGSYGFSPGKRRRPKRLVDDAGPMLIENALQLTMEMEAEGQDEDVASSEGGGTGKGDGSQGQAKAPPVATGASLSTGSIKDKQVESTKSGKKRIRPVLMSVDGGGATVTNNVSDEEREGGKKRRKEQSSDPLQNALDAASQAASVAEGVAAQAATRAGGAGSKNATQTNARSSVPVSAESHAPAGLTPAIRIPSNTSRVHSIDLATVATDVSATPSILDGGSCKIVADCTNSMAAPSGATSSWPSATLTISRGGVRQWKDVIAKAKCTALNANQQLLAVGTACGCLYLYGTSSTMGWESGKAYRAFPPFVLGSPVVEINVGATAQSTSSESSCEMVVVTSDGNFSVYTIAPAGPQLNYKGTIVPAMQHLQLSSAPSNNHRGSSISPQPKLARIQVTESKRLMLILMLPTKSSGMVLQGFVYHRNMDLWMRVSDSNNFLLSDFYSSLPAAPKEGSQGILAKMDGLVKSAGSTASAKQMFLNIADNASASEKIVTRSHCEDRLACAIALGSASEFQTWLRNYAQCLSSAGDAAALRFLVDLLLGSGQPNDHIMDGDDSHQVPSFLSAGLQCLGLEGNDVVRKAILPEMGKSRTLQRLTNEISMELEALY